MVMLLLSCAMQGILGVTFYPTKPTFSEGLGRKKLCCGRDRAPPARRFAAQGCSYICFGPIDPEVEARGPLVFTSMSCRVNKAGARVGAGIIGLKQM
ncbi:hypothetical protein ABI582_06905 [Pseudomonas sp. SAS7]|uniref:hypothetical protein n=1 Tax=Pseudomonas sp. SAS7 TaxID=3156487 RepID=UPI003F9CC51B